MAKIAVEIETVINREGTTTTTRKIKTKTPKKRHNKNKALTNQHSNLISKRRTTFTKITTDKVITKTIEIATLMTGTEAAIVAIIMEGTTTIVHTTKMLRQFRCKR